MAELAIGRGYFRGAVAASRLLVVSVVAAVLLTARPAEAIPNVFIVDRSDDPDLSATPVADNCTAAIAADCSLRGAITKANATANDPGGPDEIRFNIPGAGPHTISPTSSLPAITGTVTMDGYTQPGASKRTTTNNAVLKIELSGAGAGFASGLTLRTGAGGTAVRGLAINRFGASGVVILAENAVVEGNFVGTNLAGNADLGNGITGVSIGSSGNLIGGVSAGAMNVISGNNGNGVVVNGLNASGNRIEGNRIGTSANGTSAIGNGQGVNITVASGNSVGGPEVGASNLISGNVERGVLIAGDATDNEVQSNRIGTDVFGTGVLDNGEEGVEVFEGSNNVIGGTASRTGNIISGNGLDGVQLDRGATGNKVQGNLIGTGQNGASDLGNREAGVRVLGPGNFVGGTAGLARNVISGNGDAGISIFGADASGNRIQGNLIGTQVNGTTPLPNFHGVFIADAAGNFVGGAIPEAANTISGNVNHGVQIIGATATGNRILRNSIFENGTPGGLGIELNNDGVTPNDNKDPDAGPNRFQNFPIITSATTTTITGRLNSRPNKTFTIQFFSSPQPNFPTGFGEGQQFLSQKNVRTDANGRVNFVKNVPAVPTGRVITATATDAGGNTSEFSAARAVQ